jgi:soluble lytic murein transglycosylase
MAIKNGCRMGQGVVDSMIHIIKAKRRMRLGMALLGLVAGALLVGQSPGIAATVTPPQRQVLAARPKAAADPQNDPFLRGINALESARWDWAMAAEKQLDDNKKIRYLRWRRLVAEGYQADFSEVSGFINQHPDWPQQGKLELKAEQALIPNAEDRLVVEWFNRHPPQTLDGINRYIKALQLMGKQAEALQMLRNAWYSQNWQGTGTRDFLERFGGFLTPNDHQLRLNRLLWMNNATAARALLDKIPGEYQPVAEARLRMMDGINGVEEALTRLNSNQMADNGLLYERVRWLRKKDRDSDAQRILLATPPTEFADKWWLEREIQARRAMLAGDGTRAYELAAKHGLTPSDNNWTDAEQLAGWLALVKLQQPKRAFEHFQTVLGQSTHPNTRAKAAYWAGRAAEGAADFAAANTMWQEAAKYPTAFYGQLGFKALRRANLVASNASPWPADPKLSGQAKADFMANPMVETVNLLMRYSKAHEVEPFLVKLTETMRDPAGYAATAQLALNAKRPATAVRVARQALRSGITLIDSGYPLLQVPNDGGVEAPLLMAIIRQESGFQVDAVSVSGARGLMQLMPATAQDTARAMRKPYSLARLTIDPYYNISLGSFYARSVLTKFNNSYLMTFAAYNAGPNRAQEWANNYGDPRQPGVDPLVWVESIPFRETRGYVQRVAEGVEVYRHRLRSVNTPVPDDQVLGSGWCPISCW